MKKLFCKKRRGQFEQQDLKLVWPNCRQHNGVVPIVWMLAAMVTLLSHYKIIVPVLLTCTCLCECVRVKELELSPIVYLHLFQGLREESGRIHKPDLASFPGLLLVKVVEGLV